MDNQQTQIFERNALLDILVLFCSVYHHPCSAETLTTGLPTMPGDDVPLLFSIEQAQGLFSRAASRAGLTSALVSRPLAQFSVLQLPVILLLKDQQTCILDTISEDRTKAKIILANGDASEQWLDLEVLQSQYLGYAFLLKQQVNYDQQQAKTLNLNQRHWFWSSLNYSKNIYRDVLFASLLINLFVLATPLFTMNVYDRVIPNNAMETLQIFAIGVVVVYLLDTFLKFTRTHLLETAAKKSDVIMSSLLFEKVLGLKMANMPRSVGAFASNLKDFDSIRSFLTNATMTALIDLPFALLFLGVIFYLGGIIVLVPLTIMIMILIYALAMRKPLHRQIASSHQAAAKKNAVLIESLQNIETIKTQATQGQTQWLWEQACGEIALKSKKSRLMAASVSTVTAFLVQLNTVCIIITGVLLIQDFSLTMGGLIATMILSSRCVAPMGQAATLISTYEDAKASYLLLNEMMKLPSERPPEQEFVQLPKIRGKIEFRDVSFSYPDCEQQALTNVSFVIEPGESVAIIGRIGSGKSTIEKLLLKLYQVDSGSILIDDIEINQVDPAQFRSNIGYVPQDIQLFQGSLKSNIIGRSSHVSDRRLLEAANLSGVSEFVQSHPKGFQMPIEERGGGLSGGQRQCIGIARAFLIDSPIMLLDEPTSNMDQTSESALLTNLAPRLQGKTTILVTHKMNLLDLCQRVIVMQHGQVYLNGPKEHVLNQLLNLNNNTSTSSNKSNNEANHVES